MEQAGTGCGSPLYGGSAPDTWLGPEWRGAGATDEVFRGPLRASRRETTSYPGGMCSDACRRRRWAG